MIPQRFTYDFPCSRLRRDVHNSCLSCAGGPMGGWLPRRPKCRHLVLPSVLPPTALRRADPTRLLCVQVFDSTGTLFRRSGNFKLELGNLFITSFLAGGKALFVPGCRQVERCPLVPVRPFHARHIQKECAQCAAKALKLPHTYLLSPKSNYTTGGSRRGARRGCWATSGRTVRQ